MPLDDQELLYRRVTPEQLSRDPQSPTGWRVSSGDWDDPTDDPSVYAASLLGEGGLSVVLEGHPDHTVAEITAAEIRLASEKQAARGIRLDVVHRPDPDDKLPSRGEAHCAVTGFPAGNADRKAARKPLADRCRIVQLGRTPRAGSS